MWSQDPPYPQPDKSYGLSFPCPDDDHLRQMADSHKKSKKKKKSKPDILVESPGVQQPNYAGFGYGNGGQFSGLLDPSGQSNLPSGYSAYGNVPGADMSREKRKSRLEQDLDRIFDGLNNDLMINRRRSDVIIGAGFGQDHGPGGGIGAGAGPGSGRRSLFDNSFFGPESNLPSGNDPRQRSYGGEGRITSIFDSDSDWRRPKPESDGDTRNIPIRVDPNPYRPDPYKPSSLFPDAGKDDNRPSGISSIFDRDPYGKTDRDPYGKTDRDPYKPSPYNDNDPYVAPPPVTRPDPEPYAPPAVPAAQPDPYVPTVGGGGGYGNDGVKLRDKNRPPNPDSTLNRRSYQHQKDQQTNLKHFNSDTRYDDVAHQCRMSRRQWEDPNFSASNRVLVSSDQPSSIFAYGGRGMSSSSIQWLRPGEICQQLNLNKSPCFFGAGGIDRFDINQGEIGNCWFLAALANLAESRTIFNLVVPGQQDFEGNYSGAFRFRFWRFGDWVEVVVDDRLPTRSGDLIYIRSREKNEFWSALLEKAYAKLHGSYKALEGGLTIEAAVDFTGGIPELIDLTSSTMSELEIFHLMKKAYDRGAFLGCALGKRQNIRDAQQLGLQPRHAYTISKVVELKGSVGRARATSIPLVRVRNPHGDHKEWRGAWSDGDRKWDSIDDNMKMKLGVTKKDDGEFYMHFRDFLKYYGELEICHLGPDSFAGKEESANKFECFCFMGEWKAGVNSGGCGNDGFYAYSTNPQYFIDLNDPDPYDEQSRCPVIISLAQKQDERKKEHAIGFKVYQCSAGDKQLSESFMRSNNSYARTDTFINLREVSKRLMLPPGRFCIVPSTFARGEEGEFMLRVYAEKHWGTDTERASAVDDRFSGINGDVTVESGAGKKPKSKLEALYSWASTDSTEDKVLRDIIRSFPDDGNGEFSSRVSTKKKKSKKSKDRDLE